MEDAKEPDESKKDEELGDIDIYLFSNGQVFSPPRKYHLTAEELRLWNTTLNCLARSHYGYMHSSIDLFTMDGKKVENPSELDNNTAYVAVETKDQFLPGGYDLYLMKASQSWIKRYGGVYSTTTSKEKVNAANDDPQPEKSTIHPKTDKEKVDESTIVAPTPETINVIEVNEPNEKPRKSNLGLKPGEKIKASMNPSTIIRKSVVQTNDKKTPKPLKKKPGSPPKYNTINKLSNDYSHRESRQLKTIYSPGKSKHIPSQLISAGGANVTPEFVVPAKLSSKNKFRNEPIKEEISSKELQENVSSKILNTLQPEFIVSTKISSKSRIRNESILKKETITKPLEQHVDLINDLNYDILVENACPEKVPDILKPIIEDVDSCDNTELTNDHKSKSNADEKLSIKLGDVINLHLSIEIKNNTSDVVTRRSTDNSLPLLNNINKGRWNITISEKSSQVNMDEMTVGNEIMKSIIDEIDKGDTPEQCVILQCNCHQDCLHQMAQWSKYNTVNNQVKTVNKNNKNYIIFLPHRHDGELLRCDCDDDILKSDKSVQTNIFEDTYRPRVASFKETVDQTTFISKTSIEVNNTLHSDVSVSDPAGVKSEVFSNNKEISPNNNENTFYEDCGCTSTPLEKDLDYSRKTTPNLVTNVNSQGRADIPQQKEKVMADKAVQTEYQCFLLEARRHKDGHYSFHLPPLHVVKLYQS